MDKREARFDGWLVDFDSGEISKNGSTHRLQDQPLQILEELVRRPGELVTREQLIARLWPTGVVEFDTGLNSAMRKLRIALGDDAETPRYIETLPRKGYRFVATLEPAPPVPAPTQTTISLPALSSDYVPTPYETGQVIGRRASDRRAPLRRLILGFGALILAAVLAVVVWRMPGGLLSARTSEESFPTIVVLPLVDMSIDQNEQALCDGLTEELSNWLAHIPTLRVVARTSAFSFKGKNTDVRTIGKSLGATHILEGSLRRSGAQLRITVQLIAADTGLHIWSRSYDQPVGDIFAVEDVVSRSVAEALHLELSADTAERWAERKYGNAEALEYYLLGKQRQRRRTAEDNLKAIEYFRRAIDADPGYALALVGLSESLMNGISLNRMPLEDVSIEVEPLLNRAISLSPKLADAYAAKGWMLTEQYKFEEALPLLQQATKLNPNDSASHRFLGIYYDRRGDPNKAIERFSIAARLDPRDWNPQVFACQELMDLGEFKTAETACATARELDPTNSWGPLATSFLARAQGETEAALQWVDKAIALAPNDVLLAAQKIDLLTTLGRTAEARAVIDKVPDDGSFYRLAREGGVVFAESGAAGLKTWMDARDLTRKAATSADLTELAWLQFIAGESVSARATLAHAEKIVPLSTADLYDGSQIRYGYSAALLRAGIEIRGNGDRAMALRMLKRLDGLLDTYEENGGKHFGAYTMRAESLALQGKTREAEKALRTAYARGWRATWRASREPYLQGVDLDWINKKKD
ncbi:MAG TPA: winged helix-turn-helix domain-containing protein [Steroidobacteraceae bacterium]|nr:winged helix-turn-helix domain-containing protein [Steroidobacteraceae bacterium]